MIFDSSVKNVISSAYDCRKDVFLNIVLPDIRELSFDNVKTAVLFPGPFYSEDKHAFSDIKTQPSDCMKIFPGELLLADIRFMADEKFRSMLTESGVTRLVTVFSECADKSEYGYREAFSWIREYKAEISHFCQTVSFFSPVSNSAENVKQNLSDRDIFYVNGKYDIRVNHFLVNSPKEKFRKTAEAAEKYAYRRVCVYFNSRGEAKDFCLYLKRRGTAFSYVDGSLPLISQKESLLCFHNSSPNILVATKSYIPTSLFYPPERVIFCGAPFSPSHYYRCTFSLRERDSVVIYCEDDFIRNEKIIRAFSEYTDNEEIADKRLSRLSDMKKFLSL